MNNTKKQKVLVAMSGGLDSSVAAILLQNQGFELVGVTMKVWDYESMGENAPESGCCNLDAINDARQIAVSMGFPHYVLDFRQSFDKIVITNFIEEYLKARTPNPCVLCNTFIKWEALLEKAIELDCDYIATGHYAQVRMENDRYVLSKGVDVFKDQSYMLWGLSQESLQKTLMPLGSYSKDKIRDIAREAGFAKVANKRESYDICFIPDNDYRSFLKKQRPEIQKDIPEGNFVDVHGKILGKHKGYPFYTVGQRKGLEIALGVPAYVKHIDAKTNTIVLAFKDELFSRKVVLKECNYIKLEKISQGMKALVKIRYRDKGMLASIYQHDDRIEVVFDEGVSAVAPGQSAVAYDGEDVLFGGLIEVAYEA